MNRRETARAYYDAIDAGDYRRLRGLLTDEFHQERGDRTLQGADAFVSFMRDERPRTDTTHVIETVYAADEGLAVAGELRRADGTVWFRFVDLFEFTAERLSRLETFARSVDDE